MLPPAVHYELDRVVCALRANSIFHPHCFYPDGLGDVPGCVNAATACRVAMEDVRSESEAVRAAAMPHVPRLRLQSSESGRPFAHVAEGAFMSPAASTLPGVAAECRFQLITPQGAALGSGSGGAPRAIAIILPGTGEQGFGRRRHLVAYPLARRGVASVLLEGPFYGTRRPRGMHGSKLRALADLPVLGRATIDEARTLVAWLRSRDAAAAARAVDALPRASWPPAEVVEELGGAAAHAGAPERAAYESVVISGTSMGGLHAAMTASLLPADVGARVGVAAWLCPPSGVGVFTAGALASSVDWRALARDADESAPNAAARESALKAIDTLINCGAGASAPHSRLPNEATVDRLARAVPNVSRSALGLAARAAARLLRCTDITNFPPPARADACVFVAAAHDAYVPLDEDASAMWAHISRSWPGSSVRKIPAGHVSGSLLNIETHVDTICEVAARVTAHAESHG